MFIVYIPYVYLHIDILKQTFIINFSWFWSWKSPIPLKGKDKHDTQTLRLTFLFCGRLLSSGFPVCIATQKWLPSRLLEDIFRQGGMLDFCGRFPR